MPPQTEKQKMLHTGLARGITGGAAAKVTKRKRVATTLNDKDNVDPYGTKTVRSRVSGLQKAVMIAEHVGQVTSGPRKEGLTVRVLSV